jgi:hypothetical protein
MTKLKFLSAALIVVAMLAAPAMAHESHVSSRHVAVNANGAQYFGEGNRFRGYEGHDVWGHWGTYYGPMVPSIP